MAAESISMWSMIGTIVGSLATFLAVVVALWLPKKQIEQAREEAEKNAHKLISAQLIMVVDSLKKHLIVGEQQAILSNPIINISHLPHEVLAVIDIVKLTSLYKLMNDIDLVEQSRKEAHNLLNSQESPEFILHALVYKDSIDKLNKDTDTLISKFKSWN